MKNVLDIRNPWHVVSTIKDMPKRSCEILIRSDSGKTFVANWNAHKRQLFVQAIRSHWDNVFSCRVLDCYVDCYRIPFKENDKVMSVDKGMCVAWCEIPRDNED